MNDRVVIIIPEVRAAVQAHAEESLEERAKVAMRAARKSWLGLSDNENFSAAIGALVLEATPEERNRLEAEIRVLKALNAAIDGVPVNLATVLEGGQIDNAIGLNSLWHEVKAEEVT
ncbi:hypothetical protein LCGC14_0976620 [marine sediment metagenome]|uniref:Uncharacterized protein n=1 Tax=marine sediment metagenome TaxID=412755 RepID=A0A0F9NWB2_9ZZZZ